MAKTLTVILGAGASHGINQERQSTDHEEYRPPIAQEIFKDSPSFRNILHKYRLAEILSSDVDRKLKQNKAGFGLEQILKSYKDKLGEECFDHISRQFLQIPWYLQELFGVISQIFTNRPTEYDILVNETFARLDRVLFLTLNYDNLLELPLSLISHIDFDKEADYIQPKWMLVKIHGSINWNKKFTDVQHNDPSDDLYWRLLNNASLPLRLEDGFQIGNMRSYGAKYANNIPLYPALTVPIDGKYELNCPPPHVEGAKRFLQQCENYLIIGISGKDHDLLDILKLNAKGGKTLFVGRGKEGMDQTKSNFISKVPQLGQNESEYIDQRGFSGFVSGGKLDNFLDSIK